MYPELVQMIGAEGHQVGNHTWGHVCLQDLNTANALAEVERRMPCFKRFWAPETIGCDRRMGWWIRPLFSSSQCR